MSLDVSLIYKKEVFDYNITHNLNTMAMKVVVLNHTLYEYLWRPGELKLEKANQLIEPLKIGLLELKNNPEKYKQFNPPNGWGKYENLVEFVQEYLKHCILFPDSIIDVNR